MKTTEISFGNTKYKIVCEDPKKIQAISNDVYAFTENLRESYGSISENKLLFITALILQDKIDNLTKKLEDYKVEFNKKADTEGRNLASSLNNITEIIENIAISLEKN